MRNNPKLYREVKEADYVISLMRESLFGHRQVTWTAKDTKNLHGKLKTPVGDDELQQHVDTVEPLQNNKQFVMPGKDKSLDRFLDIDAYVDRADWDTPEEADKNDVNDEDDTIETQFGDIDISNLEI